MFSVLRGVLAHVCNAITWKAEEEGSVCEQPGLHETPSQKTKTSKKTKKGCFLSYKQKYHLLVLYCHELAAEKWHSLRIVQPLVLWQVLYG